MLIGMWLPSLLVSEQRARGRNAGIREAKALDGLKGANSDQDAGIAIVRRALEAPFCIIVDNAGFDGSFMIAKVRESDSPTFGFDAAHGDYGDLNERGILDPAKAVRVSLQNAASLSGAMITVDTAIAEGSDEAADDQVDAA